MQAVHAPSPGSRSAAALVPHSTGHHHTAVQSRTLPQLHSNSSSLNTKTGAGADSAVAVAPLAATPVLAGQLLPAIAVAVQGQQPQPQGVKAPAADDGVTVTTLPQQRRRPFAKKLAAESEASKEAAYEALWQWAADVSGVVSCDMCLIAGRECALAVSTVLVLTTC